MEAITIDDKARFVSILSFALKSGDATALTREVRQAVESRVSHEKGFVGSVVMIDRDTSQLLVISLWDSAHSWGAAQYDREIGQTVSDAVEAAQSYHIQTYETVTVVRA